MRVRYGLIALACSVAMGGASYAQTAAPSSARLLRGAPRDSVAWAGASDQPTRESLLRVHPQLVQLLGFCSYNPHATPYGLEHEWFDARVAFAPTGRSLFIDVVRRATHRTDARVTRCVRRHAASVTVPPFAASTPVVVAFPLDGAWRPRPGT